MDKYLLQSYIRKNRETQSQLAKALGITAATLSSKINESRGAQFNKREISFIIKRYGLSPEDAANIFFAEKVS